VDALDGARLMLKAAPMNLHDFARATSLIFAGAGLGWIALFSFVISPTAFKTLDQGRAERLVKNVMKAGHSALAGLCVLSGIAALVGGAVAGAVIAIVAGVFALCCQWALAPREDKPLSGHRVLKTARIVASGLTACIAPVLIVAILFTAGAI
jgi:hypothetical protein